MRETLRYLLFCLELLLQNKSNIAQINEANREYITCTLCSKQLQERKGRYNYGKIINLAKNGESLPDRVNKTRISRSIIVWPPARGWDLVKLSEM